MAAITETIAVLGYTVQIEQTSTGFKVPCGHRGRGTIVSVSLVDEKTAAVGFLGVPPSSCNAITPPLPSSGRLDILVAIAKHIAKFILKANVLIIEDGATLGSDGPPLTLLKMLRRKTPISCKTSGRSQRKQAVQTTSTLN